MTDFDKIAPFYERTNKSLVNIDSELDRSDIMKLYSRTNVVEGEQEGVPGVRTYRHSNTTDDDNSYTSGYSITLVGTIIESLQGKITVGDVEED